MSKHVIGGREGEREREKGKKRERGRKRERERKGKNEREREGENKRERTRGRKQERERERERDKQSAVQKSLMGHIADVPCVAKPFFPTTIGKGPNQKVVRWSSNFAARPGVIDHLYCLVFDTPSNFP